MRKKFLMFALGVVAVVGLNSILVSEAEALPSFARSTGQSCNSCHTVWPMLNSMGRQYKEAGYVNEEEEEAGEVSVISDALTLIKNAFGARVNFRLYDKKNYEEDPGDDADLGRMRALHEVEIYAAGIAGDGLSAFLEIEAEEEAQSKDRHKDPDGKERGGGHNPMNGIPTDIVAGVLGYHHNQAVNIHLGLAEPIFADPYSAYANGRRVTRGKRAVADKEFITGGSQFISLSGRAQSLPNLFYLGAISGNAKDDLEHTPLGNYSLRAVYDATSWLSAGILYQGEKAKHTWNSDTTPAHKNKYANEADASNVGLDVTIQFEDGLDANICYVARDDKESKEKDNILAVEAGYPIPMGKTTVVPYARVENYTTKDGKNKFTDIHFSLNCLIRPNLKGVINYEMIDKGEGGNDESRITVVADLGF